MPPVQSFNATRRNLPHWQEPGSVYFITWRTGGGLQLEPEDRTLALNAIRYWDGMRWIVYSAVVMPDHVHLLARPLPLDSTALAGAAHWNLGELLKSVKGFSSNAINKRNGRRGTFWQDESYDRIIRDDAEFEEKWNYIRNNPVRAELVRTPEEYFWLYESGNAI